MAAAPAYSWADALCQAMPEVFYPRVSGSPSMRVCPCIWGGQRWVELDSNCIQSLRCWQSVPHGHTDTPLLGLTRPGGSVMMPNLLVPRFDSNSWVLSDRQVPREKKTPKSDIRNGSGETPDLCPRGYGVISDLVILYFFYAACVMSLDKVMLGHLHRP